MLGAFQPLNKMVELVHIKAAPGPSKRVNSEVWRFFVKSISFQIWPCGYVVDSMLKFREGICLTNLPTFRWYDPQKSQKHTAPTTKQLNFNSSCSPCHTRGRLLFRTGRINSWLAKEDKRIQPENSQWSKVHWWHFILPSWWFQPIWKILVNWDNFPK